jgi:hypothetical protein
MGRRNAAIAAVAVSIICLYAGTLSSLARHWACDDHK